MRSQWRRSIRSQHRLTDGGAQHQCMRHHEPAGVDVVGRYFFSNIVASGGLGEDVVSFGNQILWIS